MVPVGVVVVVVAAMALVMAVVIALVVAVGCRDSLSDIVVFRDDFGKHGKGNRRGLLLGDCVAVAIAIAVAVQVQVI